VQCTFKVAVYDKFGLAAEAKSPGFDSGYGAFQAMLNGQFYATLDDAVTAASGTPASPDTIIVLADINMNAADNTTISAGKYIKLVSLAGGTRILKRVAGNTVPLITVNGGGELTLQNIIIDGGAVWTGGTATPPSPAFNATNTGQGAVNAGNTLVIVSGTGTKITLGAGAVLRNNCITSGGAGGGIRANAGAEVIINGGEVCYNQSGYTGGGIVLQDATQVNTKLTLISGSINNNNTSAHDGGGINAEYGIIEIQGGSITKNRANTHGGGINVNAGGSSTMTISGGEISSNVAVQKGGGIKAGRNYTVTMSGGVISGNTAGTTGNGIHVGGDAENDNCAAFIMLDGARIAANNDIYLTTGEIITIGGNLTGAAPVAVIKPAVTTAGTQVLANNGFTAANYHKFALDPSVTGSIGNDGKLAP
jgi:hypothetical protein